MIIGRHLALFISTLIFAGALHAQNAARVLVGTDKLYFARAGTKLVSKVKEQGASLKEGLAVVNYSLDSAELELPGGSILVLGPNSSLELTRIRADAPHIITFSHGLMRLRLGTARTGYYPAIVLSRNSVTGVRGDDVLLMRPKDKDFTSILSLTGEARFAQVRSEELLRSDIKTEANYKTVDRDEEGKLDLIESSARLTTLDEKIGFVLASRKAVILQSGQYSSTLDAFKMASSPTAINPYQLHLLTINRSLEFKARMSEVELVNPNNYQDQSIQKKPKIPSQGAEGELDFNNKIFRPKSGGLVDLVSGLYASPERTAAFDDNFGLYLPGPLFRIDGMTGQLVPPQTLVPSPEFGFIPKLSAQRDLGERVKRIFNLGVVYNIHSAKGELATVGERTPSKSEFANRQRVEVSLKSRTDSLEVTSDTATEQTDSDSNFAIDLAWKSESYKKWSALLEFGYYGADYSESSSGQSSESLFNLGFGASRLMTSRLSLAVGMRFVQRHMMDIDGTSSQIVKVTMPHFFSELDATLFEAFSARLKWEAKGALMANLEKSKGKLVVDPGLGLRLSTGPWWWMRARTGIGLIFSYETFSFDTTGESETLEQKVSRTSIGFSLAHAF